MSFLSSLITNILSPSGFLNRDAQIFLRGANGEKIQFPVPPGEFKASVSQNNQTVNVSSIGDLNMIGNDGLISITFSSFFPAQEYSFCVCAPDSPYSYVQTIENFRKSRLPSRITIADTSINYPVTIDSFEWGEDDGTGDVTFTLGLKEYVYVGNAADKTADALTGLKKRSDISRAQKAIKTVTVYPGDSLMDVAARTVGQNLKMGEASGKYLPLYKKLAKHQRIMPGEVLRTTTGGNVKIGGTVIKL